MRNNCPFLMKHEMLNRVLSFSFLSFIDAYKTKTKTKTSESFDEYTRPKKRRVSVCSTTNGSRF